MVINDTSEDDHDDDYDNAMIRNFLLSNSRIIDRIYPVVVSRSVDHPKARTQNDYEYAVDARARRYDNNEIDDGPDDHYHDNDATNHNGHNGDADNRDNDVHRSADCDNEDEQDDNRIMDVDVDFADDDEHDYGINADYDEQRQQ